MGSHEEVDPPPLKTLANRLLNPIRFLRTKRRILQGYNMLEVPPEEVRKHYMGPWTFNLYESALAAVPSIAAIWTFNILFPMPISSNLRWAYQDTVHRIKQQFAAADYMLKIFFDALQVFDPLRIPLSITAASFVVAWVTCIGSGCGELAVKRNRYAYLYFDGAYGLVAQMLSTLGVTLAVWLGFRLEVTQLLRYPPLFVFFCSIAGIGIVWQAYLTLYRIPGRLFALVDGPAPSRHRQHFHFWRFIRWLAYSVLAVPAVVISFVVVNWLGIVLSATIGFFGGGLAHWLSRS